VGVSLRRSRAILGRVVNARDVLGPDSVLSRIMPRWEHREGQLRMAEAVEAALSGEHHLFVEAGTGTGKTLAYLFPALLSGRKVVVSTATKALQEQVFLKDLPLALQVLEAYGIRARGSMMKGLSNYLCLRRFGEAQGAGNGLDRAAQRIAHWARQTATGDRAELDDLPDESPAWTDVASSSETRIGAPCPHFEACFVTRMKREAEEAQIIVVNHHLFLADLILRVAARANVLPAYDAVILDEAHAFEDIATEFFGTRVSSARIDAILRDAERSLGMTKAAETSEGAPMRIAIAGARRQATLFFASLTPSGFGPDRSFFGPNDVTPSLLAAYDALDVRLQAVEADAEARLEESMQAIARRASELRADLRRLVRGAMAPDDEDACPDEVRWIDRRPRSISLGASPVNVGASLRRHLFDRVPTVVCTSATLATADSFHFAKASLGSPPEARELAVPSPFDFASHAVLYLPEDLPDPAGAGFEEAATERIAELVRLTDGGAFVLCTSARSMRALHSRLRARALGELLLQGERPKHLLLDQFRASGRAVLVATMSFWEGVDVPGWALRLVIMEKAPFAPPNDPVVAARCARLDREGGSGFAQYSVPAAAMTLKQGFGRLIRSERDAGIVAILDRRVVRRGYGRALLAALPPARRVRTVAELRVAWDELALRFAPAPAVPPPRVVEQATTRPPDPHVLNGRPHE
jgi:ATP-dependent DNA helicase DinG